MIGKHEDLFPQKNQISFGQSPRGGGGVGVGVKS